MGWTGHELVRHDWKLFTRGGTEGVFVQQIKNKQLVGPEIIIPSKLIRMLVAEDVRRARQEKLDGMTDDEILGLL